MTPASDADPYSLAAYVDDVQRLWDRVPDDHSRAAGVCAAMQRLLNQAANAPWSEALWREQTRARVLYRDERHGFVQMAHYHGGDHSNAPHDHGPHWVVYGVARGAIEIATYRPAARTDGVTVDERHTLNPGTAHIYPMGAIHSTRQLARDGSIVLRFLSQDLSGVPRQRYPWHEIKE